MKRILVTGGAGFIGSFLVERLISAGFQVTILDRLEKQVHASQTPVIPKGVRFIRGDVGDSEALNRSLDGVHAIAHLAAAVGVGQSMYQIQRYVDLNTFQTARFLERLVQRKRLVGKLLVASSMSIYGEGAYRSRKRPLVMVADRSLPLLRKKKWDPQDPDDAAKPLTPIPTPETLTLHPTSIYAITKRDQEEMCLTVGKAYRLPTIALRFFNVYGPRQALSNPYTGVGAIFSSRLVNGQPPVIFEDGQQRRDFVHVSDIVEACFLALTRSGGNYRAMNVGTGRALSVLDMATILCQKLNPRIKPVVTQRFRVGDVRHCYADIRLIYESLGYRPKIRFEEGIDDLVQWVRQQHSQDRHRKATSELKQKGLIV